MFEIFALIYCSYLVFDKKISAPEVFKLVFDSNDKVISIENLEFDDLK